MPHSDKPIAWKWDFCQLALPQGQVSCTPDALGRWPGDLPLQQWGGSNPQSAPGTVRLPAHEFIRRLEGAQAEGEADLVAGNMTELNRLILDLQRAQSEIAELHARATLIRDMHEPSAERRQGPPF